MKFEELAAMAVPDLLDLGRAVLDQIEGHSTAALADLVLLGKTVFDQIETKHKENLTVDPDGIAVAGEIGADALEDSRFGIPGLPATKP